MMRRGLQIPSFSFPGVGPDGMFEQVASIATAAEAAGFDSIWVMDHFHQLPMVGGADEPILEGYTALAAIAARTSQAHLGTMVTGVTYRNPALLAKIVTSLDVISGGRAILGIGAAWFDEEHTAYGFEFPPVGERFDRLEEALQICRAMFREDGASFSGRYYRIENARNVPRPLQPGGPPVMVGGSGERRTLRLVARYADASNIFGDVATVRHKLDVLERHCAEVGRDPSEIVRTRLATLVVGATQEAAERTFEETLAPRWGTGREAFGAVGMLGSPDSVAEQMAAYREAGLDGMVVNLPDASDLEAVELAGKALGQVFG